MIKNIEIQADDSFIHTILNDGVVVCRNVITPNQIHLMKNEINRIHNIVMAKLNGMKRPIRTYSDIAERYLGRLDYRCGFTANIFNEIEKSITKIIMKISPKIDFRHYWGAIPSLGQTGPTNMHRDVYPILNTTEGVDLDILDLILPPYYFTVLIPLVEITNENGPTEFIKQSHRVPIIYKESYEIYAPLLSPGDMVIFEGRTMHRGSANYTNEERLIAYITFVANWYHDQTFEVNDYLFPELLIKR
jgi:ectoine hydroxylase-related dioxygenase (phytanoyl-CoA dioxygenase family)